MFGLKKKLERKLIPYYYNWICKPLILRRIQSQEKVRVLFFVANVGMWKYDGFFRLLLADPRFEPLIVSYLYPGDKEEYRRYVQQSMKEYFTAKGYPFYESYDFGTGKFLDVKRMRPDVIFWLQPYDHGYEGFRARSFIHRSLFAYIPYCYNMEDRPLFFDNLLHDIAWRLYYPTRHHAGVVARYSSFAASSLVVVGYPMADRLLSRDPVDYSRWKVKDPAVKRVIWAPHHSILEEDLLHYSSFLKIADGMLELARKYEGKIQFAFKPHPRLKPKLQQMPSWGVEKTEAYYRQWETMSNSVFVEGDYVDLFRSSDALMHDCSSFMGEYLFFNKPVTFLSARKDAAVCVNDFGKQCLECHYESVTMEQIERFLDDVVLKGIDPMEPARRRFQSTLMAEGNVAERIYGDFRAGLRR